MMNDSVKYWIIIFEYSTAFEIVAIRLIAFLILYFILHDSYIIWPKMTPTVNFK